MAPAAQVRSFDTMDRERFRAEILPSAEPAILRGIAADWPVVRAAAAPGGVLAYLKRIGGDAACEIATGAPEIKGRLFYDAALTDLNFTRAPATLGAVADRLIAAADNPHPPAIAAQAVPAMPAFAAENRLDLVDADVRPRLWLGNRIVTATHQDTQSNVAVVAAGRRRFTLFPPDQVGNLYLGPFEFTPAGTPVSLVDPDAPDLARFPRFAAAQAHARVAELEPGDALYIPYLWWHHVRSLDPVGLLVNYWWNEVPSAAPGLAPIDVLVHALLAFADLPAEQRAAWRPMFETVIFDPGAFPADIPQSRRGIRGAISPEAKQRLRRQLGQLLSR